MDKQISSAVTHDTQTIELDDGYKVSARIWRPESSSGTVLYFHGIQSHGGWYEQSGQRLADARFNVFMPDRRGSGVNDSPRGHFESIGQCARDSHRLLDVVLGETGEQSAHLVGVSWGGKQAVQLAQLEPERVRSISLVCPGLFPRIDLTMTEKFRVGMAMVNDRDRLFDIPLNDAGYFTDNPDWLRFVESDELKLLQVSASFLLTSRLIDRQIKSFPQSAYRGPIHLFLAGHDRIIDNAKTRNWATALPASDVKVTEYGQAHHTIEFEPDPEPFFEDLVSWMIAR